MLNILIVILKILLCLIFFLLIILIMPVKYILDIKFDNKIHAHFHLNYLFGLVKFKYENGKKNKFQILNFNLLKNSHAKINNEPDLKTTITKKISMLNKNKLPGENNFKYEDIKPILSPTLEFIKDIIQKIRPRKIIIDGEIGFDDPALTGYFCAAEKFICFTANIKPNIKYNFNEKICCLHFLFRGHSSALLFILIMIRYIRNEHVFSFVKANFISKEVY